MKKRMSLVAASMALVLGLAGCKEKKDGTETTAATTAAVTTEAMTAEVTTAQATTAEVTTAEAVTTQAPTTEAPVSTTAEPTSEEETETEENTALLSIDEKSFPDEAFRAYVAKEFDKNGDGALSEKERKAVTSIYVSKLGIADVTGIEFFTELYYLDCSQNQLTELDVSQIPELYTLECYSNQLTKLDVSQNPKLAYLLCSDNQLESLDLSLNTDLSSLYCHQNPLTDLKMYPKVNIEITVDAGVAISGNEKNEHSVQFIDRDMVVQIDPVTGATIYPDGDYCTSVIYPDEEYDFKEMEAWAESWCTSAKAENGFLYIEGYLELFVGDGHICLPLAEDVSFQSGDWDIHPMTQEEFNESYGPLIYLGIRNGVVVGVSCSS